MFCCYLFETWKREKKGEKIKKENDILLERNHADPLCAKVNKL